MEQTAAERHYENLRKAQAAYWKRKNPNPKPRGRPKKNQEVSSSEVSSSEVSSSTSSSTSSSSILGKI